MAFQLAKSLQFVLIDCECIKYNGYFCYGSRYKCNIFLPLREIILNKFIEFCDTFSIIELKYLVRDTS